MTENNQRLNSTNEIIENDKEKLHKSWENLFSALKALSKTRQEPVNTFVPVMEIRFDDPAPQEEYFLRINPAIKSTEDKSTDESIETVVLDVTCNEITTQQWVVKAKWIEGKPKFVDSDHAYFAHGGIRFTSDIIASFATHVIKEYEAGFLEANNPSVLWPAPKGYSRQIH